MGRGSRREGVRERYRGVLCHTSRKFAREYTMPLTPIDAKNLTITDLLLRNARDHPDHPALSWQTARATTESDRTTLTWSQVRDRVLTLARVPRPVPCIPAPGC